MMSSTGSFSLLISGPKTELSKGLRGLLSSWSENKTKKENVQQENVLQNAVDGLLAVSDDAKTHSDEFLTELQLLSFLLGKFGSDEIKWLAYVYSLSSRFSSCSSRFLRRS